MTKIINWLIYSSENRNRFSHTFIGICGFLATYIIFNPAWFYMYPWVDSNFELVVMAILGVIRVTGLWVFGWIGVQGLIRKIGSTMDGKNDVLKNK